MKTKSKLVLFYEMFLNTYYYNQNKDLELSKKLAYVAIRNIIGVVVFMFSLLLLVVVTGVFDIVLDLRKNRFILYFIMGIFIFTYFYFSKKFLKPIFDDVELGKEKPSKNFFLITVVLLGLFGGVMFAFLKLLNFYLH